MRTKIPFGSVGGATVLAGLVCGLLVGTAHSAVAEGQIPACELDACNVAAGSCRATDVLYNCNMKPGGGCESKACVS